jgi:conserved hypothetical phage tail region protein
MADSADDQRTRYPLSSFNFRVTIGESTMSFTEVGGLVREHQTLAYAHGLSYWEGESLAKFRYDKYTPVTLKRGVVAGITQLTQWLESPDEKSVSVSLCDEKGEAVVTWQIKRARLIKLEGAPLQASSNEPAIDSMTLMASGISVEHH